MNVIKITKVWTEETETIYIPLDKVSRVVHQQKKEGTRKETVKIFVGNLPPVILAKQEHIDQFLPKYQRYIKRVIK